MDTRREFLAAIGIGLLGTRVAGAQTGRGDPAPPVRKVKTTPLFKSPEGYPNAIAAAPDGLWIAEQKTDNAHLVDWNGKLLRQISLNATTTAHRQIYTVADLGTAKAGTLVIKTLSSGRVYLDGLGLSRV